MSVVVRPLTEVDLPQARRICCAAFGTFLGAPDPENFWADRDYVYGRFGAEHVASFAAEKDGELLGRISPHAGAASASSDRTRFIQRSKEAAAAKP